MDEDKKRRYKASRNKADQRIKQSMAGRQRLNEVK